MVNEQMLEDIKYMNATKEYFQIFVVHNPEDELEILQDQESIKIYLSIFLNHNFFRLSRTTHTPFKYF
jgi:hypothetical protein